MESSTSKLQFGTPILDCLIGILDDSIDLPTSVGISYVDTRWLSFYLIKIKPDKCIVQTQLLSIMWLYCKDSLHFILDFLIWVTSMNCCSLLDF